MKIVPIIVIGKGNVGRSLLGLLASVRPRFRERGADLRVIGIAGRSSGAFVQEGISDSSLAAVATGAAALESLPSACPHEGWEDLTERIKALGLDGRIVVDVTAEQAEDAHLSWLGSGWHVVTANKKPLTAASGVFDALMAASRSAEGPRYRFEAACGAGLPVIGCLRDMLEGGDQVLGIRGAVSGTLGFLFAACERGMAFADAVAEAKAKGFTEPDPRDDLSGADVARKALILARLAGWRLELADIPVADLVPPRLKDGSVDDFMRGLASAAGDLDARFADAGRRGKSLRYLASADEAGVRVGIEEVDAGREFGSLAGPENMFVIRTRRYDAVPLTVRGPGAGAEVTAAGVFSDILRIAGL